MSQDFSCKTCIPSPAVKMLVLDVDGVLTDGSIYLTDSGEELKGV